MDLAAVIRARRMTRRFDSEPLPAGTVEHLVDLAMRAPSAGFTQGWDIVSLATRPERTRFWTAARPTSAAPDAWLAGVSGAPVLLVLVSDPGAYLDRYAEPDKGWTDRDPARWPVPYWDTDTAMAAMLILLGAEDIGLGALFFGVPAPRHQAVSRALGLPPGRRLVGVIALGRRSPTQVRSPSLRRRRRRREEVLHRGRFVEH